VGVSANYLLKLKLPPVETNKTFANLSLKHDITAFLKIWTVKNLDLVYGSIICVINNVHRL